ncbi:MAG: hypothetical protein IKL82_03405, partial [Clostridia bacterium]|nr:hypothetical protein [Clostridia bacterium]
DDKVIIIYNHDGDNRTELGIDEIESAFGSDLTQLTPPNKRQVVFRHLLFILVKFMGDLNGWVSATYTK